MVTYLDLVKPPLDVEDDGFDPELTMYVNSAISSAVQIGVTEFEGVVVKSDTLWPDFTDRPVLDALCRSYVTLKVKRLFDPTASATIAKAFSDEVGELEFRIQTECERLSALETPEEV